MVAENSVTEQPDPDLKHDRYAVYHMIGKHITFNTPSRNSRQCTGIAQRVCRDIFSSMVEVTVSGRTFRFKEPTAIAKIGNAVVFVYGRASNDDMQDSELYSYLREAAYRGETIDNIIHNTMPSRVKLLRFDVQPAESSVLAS